MLRAAHRVLEPGGAVCFLVIAPADDLTEAETAEAVAAGPPFVASDLPYQDLMAAAGFERIEVHDVTEDYLRTLGAWIREWEAERSELVGVVSRTEFAERQQNRETAVRAISSGLLRRYLVSGERT